MNVASGHHLPGLLVPRPEERAWAAMAHLACVVPIWGFAVLVLLWLNFRMKSREIVFHIKQAVAFHAVILVVLLFCVVVQILLRVLHQLSPLLAEAATVANWWVCISAWSMLALMCAFGAASVYAGRPFLYPIIGRRVFEGSARKFLQE